MPVLTPESISEIRLMLRTIFDQDNCEHDWDIFALDDNSLLPSEQWAILCKDCNLIYSHDTKGA